MLAVALEPSIVTAGPYNPLQQQFREADTTFLFDPDADAAAGVPITGNRADLGGFINGVDSAVPNIVAGRFRKGVNPSSSTSYLWCPMDGMLPTAEFTYEFWIKSTVDWATTSGSFNCADGLWFVQASGKATFSLIHPHNPAVVGTYTFPIASSETFTTGQYPAGTSMVWVLTLKNGVVTMYRGKQGDTNVTQVAQVSGYVPPQIWGSNNRQDGIRLISNGSSSPTAWTLSDLRISRYKRTPGVVPTITDVSTFTIGATPTGAAVQPLNGLTKPPTGYPGLSQGAQSVSYPSAVNAAQAKSEKAFGPIRIDKFMETTPMKVGGTDALHPTLGHSGAFSYDFQILDRELDWVINKMGAKVQFQFNNTPQILGGGKAPFTALSMTTTAAPQQPESANKINFTASVTTAPAGATNGALVSYGGNTWAYGSRGATSLTGILLVSGTPGLVIPAGATVSVGALNGWAYYASGSKGPPSSLTDHATICLDIAYRILVTLGYGPSVWGWSLWNEPDQATEWTAGDVADMNTLYGLIMPGIKALDSTQRVGGLELSNNNLSVANNTWLIPWLNYCVAHGLPVDYISYHSYSGSPNAPAAQQITMAQIVAAAGLPNTPDLQVTEWGWQSAWTGFDPGAGTFPFEQPNGKSAASNPAPTPQPGHCDFAANDFNASFHAITMCAMQNANYGSLKFVSANHYKGDDLSIIDQNDVVQPMYNVSKMWGAMVGAAVYPLTLDADPGMLGVAAKTGDGKMHLLIANHHYQMLKPSFPIKIDVSATGIANGTAAVLQRTDRTRANAYDAPGTDNLVPETLSPVGGGHVSLSLGPRSVAHVVIG